MRRAALAHPACSPRFPSHPLQSPRDYLTPPCRTTLLPRHFPLLPPPSPSLFLPPSRLESVFPSPTLPRSTTMCRVPAEPLDFIFIYPDPSPPGSIPFLSEYSGFYSSFISGGRKLPRSANTHLSPWQSNFYCFFMFFQLFLFILFIYVATCVILYLCCHIFVNINTPVN